MVRWDGWDGDWMLLLRMVFTVALGLSVDATIHVLARFNEERKAGADISDAVHEAVMHSGQAIAITSVILAVAFGVVLFMLSQIMLFLRRWAPSLYWAHCSQICWCSHRCSLWHFEGSSTRHLR